MLGRLDQRFRLLTGGARDQPARLRSLRDAIAWSHDLLTPDEQTLFRRLAVFVGGCTLEAAEAVVAAEGDPAHGVLEGIASLADKSLLRQMGESDGEPRFVMLETIRDFALERLEASGEEAKVRDRHALWCLRLAERTEASAFGDPEQRARFDRLQADYDNVRAALAWSLDQGDAAGLRLAAAMGGFWYVRGPLGEARAWLDRALALAASDATPPALRARVLTAAGLAAHRQFDVARAEALLGESVTLWREAGDERRLAEALWFHVMTLPDDDRATLAQSEAALALFRKHAHPLARYAPLAVGWSAHMLGDDARAIAVLEEGHAQLRQDGDEWGAAGCLWRLAVVMLDRGEAARAAAFALESLDLFWAHGDQAAAIECLVVLTGAAAALGQLEPAGRLIGAADRLRDMLGIVLIPDFERMDGRAAVRARLGEDRAAEVFAAGRTPPLADVIAEAHALAAELTTAPAGAAPASLAPSGLSPREVEVLRLVADGLSDRAIAAALFIGPGTVRTHLANIYSKLEVGSRTAAVAAARRRGIL
jgi:non-specific serine/threonine protein kinase